jgi:Na+-transporting methylmalonyl-CoA/oxaloacetate decarboxylase gamma subunit
LMLVGGIILWGIVILSFLILAIWLLGKIIIFIWNKFFKEKI